MMSPQIDPERIARRIEALAGLTEPGRPWTRTAFSQLYTDAREWLREEMRSVGLNTEIDAGANLIGTLPGQRNELGALGLGSHIDTVPDGGRFDGIAGVIAALEVAQAIKEAGLHLQHPLAVIDFLAEEPNRFGLSCVGSRAIAGELSAEMLQVASPEGETLAEGIARMGGDPRKLDGPLLSPAHMRAFMELHIEQGIRLESAGDDIGIVTGIVGISRAEVTFSGRADHSGTTPMNRRQDALVAAAQFVSAVEERAGKSCEDGHVATVGKLQVFPNAANAVPGRVVLTLEVRALGMETVNAFFAWVENMVAKLEAERGVRGSIVPLSSGAPVAMDESLRMRLAKAAADADLSTQLMPSGGGHDTAFMSRICPVGMIFIPCRDGRSHCPEEWSSTEQIALGARTLLNAVLALDGEVVGSAVGRGEA
ncbi:MAG: Zn-dependent hydrolase [Rhizobiaceae bacterium]|nr:Zn-dependent hydrolase [Rhizobiaceae bacterium]